MEIMCEVDKSLISGEFVNPKTELMESFFIPGSRFIVFQLRIQADISSLELSQLRLVWWLVNKKNWHQSDISFKVFFRQLSMDMVKYEDKMILSQKYIFCDHNVVN